MRAQKAGSKRSALCSRRLARGAGGAVGASMLGAAEGGASGQGGEGVASHAARTGAAGRSRAAGLVGRGGYAGHAGAAAAVGAGHAGAACAEGGFSTVMRKGVKNALYLFLCFALAMGLLPVLPGVQQAEAVVDIGANPEPDVDIVVAMPTDYPGTFLDFKEEMTDALVAAGLDESKFRITDPSVTIDTTDLSSWYVYDHYSSQATYNALGLNSQTQPFAQADNSCTGGSYSSITDYIKDWKTRYGASSFPNRCMVLNSHIQSVQEDDGTASIYFMGYGSNALTDYMFYPAASDTRRTFSFNIEASVVDTHTLQGAGYLLNTGIDSNGNLQGYVLYYSFTSNTSGTVRIGKLNGINASSMRNGVLDSNNSKVTWLSGVTQSFSLRSDTKKIRVTADLQKDKVTLQQQDYYTDGSLSKATTLFGGAVALTPNGYNGVGPIVSYTSHGCSALSAFTFTDVVMTYEANAFNSLEGSQYYEGAQQKYFINLGTQSGDANIPDPDKSDTQSAYINGLKRLADNEIFYISNVNDGNVLSEPEHDESGACTNYGLSSANGLYATNNDYITQMAEYIVENYNNKVKYTEINFDNPLSQANFYLINNETNKQVMTIHQQHMKAGESVKVGVNSFSNKSKPSLSGTKVSYYKYRVIDPDNNVMLDKTTSWLSNYDDFWWNFTNQSTEGKWTFELTVLDDAGIESNAYSTYLTVFKDDEVPSIDVENGLKTTGKLAMTHITLTDNGPGINKDGITLNEDGSGIAKYFVGGEGENPDTDNSWIELDEPVHELTITEDAEDYEKTGMVVWAEDECGNRTETTVFKVTHITVLDEEFEEVYDYYVVRNTTLNNLPEPEVETYYDDAGTPYAFSGWYSYDYKENEVNTVISENTVIEDVASLTIYPVYSNDVGHLTFVGNGGQIHYNHADGTQVEDSIEFDEVPEGISYTMAVNTYGKSITPVREGYNFTGWTLDAAGENAITTERIIKYVEKPVEVETEANNKTDNNFATEGEGNTKVIGDQTITNIISSDTDTTQYEYENKVYAQWEVGKYKLSYNGNGGTCSIKSAEIEYNTSAYSNSISKIQSRQNPDRPGYTFVGWSLTADNSTGLVTSGAKQTLVKDFTMPAHDVTLYAVWELDTSQFIVSYKSFPDEMGSPDVNAAATQTQSYSKNPSTTDDKTVSSVPSASRSGYAFKGWYFVDVEEVTEVPATDKWESNVTYYTQNGTIAKSTEKKEVVQPEEENSDDINKTEEGTEKTEENNFDENGTPISSLSLLTEDDPDDTEGNSGDLKDTENTSPNDDEEETIEEEPQTYYKITWKQQFVAGAVMNCVKSTTSTSGSITIVQSDGTQTVNTDAGFDVVAKWEPVETQYTVNSYIANSADSTNVSGYKLGQIDKSRKAMTESSVALDETDEASIPEIITVDGVDYWYNAEKTAAWGKISGTVIGSPYLQLNLYYDRFLSITVPTDPVGGTIGGDYTDIKEGETATVTWTPDEGYYVSKVEVDGEYRDDLISAGKIEFDGLSSDHEVNVVFTKIGEGTTSTSGGAGNTNAYYKLTTKLTGCTCGECYITPSQTVKYGEQTNAKVTLGEGCYISQVLVDGEVYASTSALTDNEYGLAFKGMQSNHTVEVTIGNMPTLGGSSTPGKYTVTVNRYGGGKDANGKDVKISPSNVLDAGETYQVRWGGTQDNETYGGNDKYYVYKVVVDGSATDSNGKAYSSLNKVDFKKISANHVVDIYFAAKDTATTTPTTTTPTNPSDGEGGGGDNSSTQPGTSGSGDEQNNNGGGGSDEKADDTTGGTNEKTAEDLNGGITSNGDPAYLQFLSVNTKIVGGTGTITGSAYLQAGQGFDVSWDVINNEDKSSNKYTAYKVGEVEIKTTNSETGEVSSVTYNADEIGSSHSIESVTSDMEIIVKLIASKYHVSISQFGPGSVGGSSKSVWEGQDYTAITVTPNSGAVVSKYRIVSGDYSTVWSARGSANDVLSSASKSSTAVSTLSIDSAVALLDEGDDSGESTTSATTIKGTSLDHPVTFTGGNIDLSNINDDVLIEVYFEALSVAKSSSATSSDTTGTTGSTGTGTSGTTTEKPERTYPSVTNSTTGSGSDDDPDNESATKDSPYKDLTPKDTDGDGTPDVNVDTDGDGIPDVNIDTDNDGIPDVNVDTDGDGIPDVNIDVDSDGVIDINIVDADGDGKPDTGITANEDGKWPAPTVSVVDEKATKDKDGKITYPAKPGTGSEDDDEPESYFLNIDTDGDGVADLNVDFDSDGIPDVNIVTDGEGNLTKEITPDTDSEGNKVWPSPTVNVDINGDGYPDLNIDEDGPTEGGVYKPTTNIVPATDDDGTIKKDDKGNIVPATIDIAQIKKEAEEKDKNPEDLAPKATVNIDTDGDGVPDVNVDTNGDGIPDVNIDTDGDGTADLNVDPDGPNAKGEYEPTVNLVVGEDGNPTTKVKPTENDGKGGYTWPNPSVNIDTDGDGQPDLNITDEDGNIYLNIVDADGDGKPDTSIAKTDGVWPKANVNVDVTGDGNPDLNVDADGDGNPDTMIDTDGDGIPENPVDIIKLITLFDPATTYTVNGRIVGSDGSLLILDGESAAVTVTSASGNSGILEKGESATVSCAVPANTSISQVKVKNSKGEVIYTASADDITVSTKGSGTTAKCNIPSGLIDSDSTIEVLAIEPLAAAASVGGNKEEFVINIEYKGAAAAIKRNSEPITGILKGQTRTVEWDVDTDYKVDYIVIDGEIIPAEYFESDGVYPNDGRYEFTSVTADHDVVIYTSKVGALSTNVNVGGTIINRDTNGDGIPDVDIDTDGDGIPDSKLDKNGNGIADEDEYYGYDTDDVNIDKDGNGKPDVNVDVTGNGKADVNIDTTGNGIPDLNIVDSDYDGIPDKDFDIAGGEMPTATVNVDTDGDGVADKNVDADGNGIPDVNLDTTGDGVPNANLDTTGDGKPDLNIVDSDYDGIPDGDFDLRDGDSIIPTVNIDVDGDGTADNNVDQDGNGIPDVNLDIDGDGKADYNIDIDGDGIPDINVIDIDKDGKHDTDFNLNLLDVNITDLVNVDMDNDGVPDLNIDTDGDGIADTNIDTDGDGVADLNIDTDGDGIADANLDTDGDGIADTNLVDVDKNEPTQTNTEGTNDVQNANNANGNEGNNTNSTNTDSTSSADITDVTNGATIDTAQVSGQSTGADQSAGASILAQTGDNAILWAAGASGLAAMWALILGGAFMRSRKQQPAAHATHKHPTLRK